MDRGGRWLAVGHADGVVALWDLRHAQLLVGKELARGGQPAPADKKQQQEKQRAKERLAVPVT